MLTIGKLGASPTAGRYYADQVAQGREDYYAGEGEAPATWLGGGAAALGLDGSVSEQGIVRLLSADDPATGEPLRQPLRSGAVAGFDLTFRAPKSVGVLFGVCETEVVREIVAAHEAAVRDALGYLEREACMARRGHGGAVLVRGGGFIAAAFRHRSSRAGDPLLHTHVVIANATQGPDGRWSALDGRLLYRHAKTAGYLYQASLRSELTERLGLRWHPVERGTADVAGVPRAVIDHFSRRRAEILEHMEARGETSARAAQVATLETRRRKEYGVPVDRLREEWRARATEHGLGRFELRRALRRDPSHRRSQLLDEVAERLLSEDALTVGQSTFTRRDVLQALAELARDGAPVSSVERLADRLLRDDEVVALTIEKGEQRYTTRSLLRTERLLLERADHRRAVGVAVAPEDALHATLAARPTLSSEQRELVVALARRGDGVAVVRAAAGTGKTFALEAAAEAWRRTGIPVLGCALSARAACELRDQAGIDTTTIARLKRALDSGIELGRGAVLIVDEAGMAGTRDLAKLAEAAERSDAKLVLVGDDRQLPEIEAGGAFRALADRLPAVELQEIRRQREEWDRKALTALREGDVDQFVREYNDHGRVVATPNARAQRQALVEDWWMARERGADALMIAHRRRDVADLNTRARERMRAAGRLGEIELRAGSREFAVGDRVVATRNDYGIGLVNGESGVVAALAPEHLLVALDGDRHVDMPTEFAAEHLDHGYAVTAHRAQGATVDRTFVLGSDELYREWGYTALSRHRDSARFYISATPTFLNETAPALETGGDVTSRAAAMLEASQRKQLALSGITVDHDAIRIEEELRCEQARLEDIDRRLAALDADRKDARWYQPGRRAELARRIDEVLDNGHQTRSRIDRLLAELEQKPTQTKPLTMRAADPLTEFEPSLERDALRAAHERRREQARACDHLER